MEEKRLQTVLLAFICSMMIIGSIYISHLTNSVEEYIYRNIRNISIAVNSMKQTMCAAMSIQQKQLMC